MKPITKQQLRDRAKAARASQADKDLVSRSVIDRLLGLSRYQTSDVVAWYVDVRDEVRTKHALPEAIESGKKIAVPYCLDDKLALFHLESMDELQQGQYGIPEPRSELRRMPEKSISVDSLDLVLVPGVAFDSVGGRLGHGKGYYDRLLSRVHTTTTKLGVAFDCQLVDRVPTEPHDITMDMVVTQTRVFRSGRQEHGTGE